jgi:two-component system aerobic respiration control sensor histidine kinase ArcB
LISVNKAFLGMFDVGSGTELKWRLLGSPYMPEEVKQKVCAGQVVRYEMHWDFEEVKRLKLYETTRAGVAHFDVLVSPLGPSQGEPLRGYLVQTQDVTERRRAEEALRGSEEKYRLLADNVTDLIYVLDMNMNPVYVSPSITPLLGFSVEEGMARGLTESLTPASLEVAAKAVQDVMHVEEKRPGGFRGRGTLEVEMYRKDGSTLWVESSVTVLRDPDGRPVGLLGVTRDISERKRAQDELREVYQREAKVRSELEGEMKKRVEFTRALVHELKTPLTSVIASSELLASELPEGPLLRMAKNINRGANDLNNRVDELLDVARGELGMLRLNLTCVDPLRMLRGLAEDMGPVALSRHQSLILDLPRSLLLVWGDENRLRQVVLNLLSNACKFTGEGGNVTLKAKEEVDRLIVEVEDTGPGISEAEQQRLFTPYYRGEGDRKRFSGLGLGLALCKTLVELHGGQIWIRSQPGKGSTFGFSVPLATANQRGEIAEAEEE